MNKISKYFAFAAALALVSCSNDEPNTPTVTPGEGETAYMKVALRDANGSRADNFEYSTGAEGKANDAEFFFFDANGVYVSQATYTPIKGGRPNPEDTNIEFKGEAIVVLENIKSKDAPDYPSYMITLINCKGDAEFTDAKLQGKTMQQFTKLISTWGNGDATNGKFRMSSTSYFNGDFAYTDHSDAYYYATALSTENFARTPELAASTNPVKVYVERLAARVKLVTKDNQKYFTVKATVAGLGNGPVGEPEAATELTVRIDGWGLNGVNESSYISKQLTGWDANKTFGTDWEWNRPGFRRSYWGQSNLYGATYNVDTYKQILKFFEYDAMTAEVGDVRYCNENTNTKEKLALASGLPNQRMLTSVVVKATVGTGTGDAFQALDLVEYNGVYFKKDAFVAYVLGVLNANGNLKYYTKTTTEPTEKDGVVADGNNYYKQIDATMFAIDGSNDRVYVVKGENFTTEQLYTYTEDPTTKVKTWSATDAANLAQDLKNATSDKLCRAFNGGQMVYNIPIAHENDKVYSGTTPTDNKDLTAWYEGSFGVVRNTAYEVKINTILHLGQGVFNPGDANDPIIPDEDPKDPQWYMGAVINILSWKIVENNVDL